MDGVFEVALGGEVNGHCGGLGLSFVMRGLDPRIHPNRVLQDGLPDQVRQ
jgi:hypothetical protein